MLSLQVTSRTRPAFVLLEALLSAALLIILTSAFSQLILQSLSSQERSIDTAQAQLLAEEGIEALRSIASASFPAVTSGTYGIAVQGNAYALSGASDTSNSFVRSVTIADVRRNGAGTIVTQGGSVDDLTKEIISRVTWGQRTVELRTYVSDWNAVEIKDKKDK